MHRHRHLYILLLPTLVYLILFRYLPIYGVSLAFKKFHYMKGITASPWVGWANFEAILSKEDFWRAFGNTLVIALYRLVLEFPIPIVLALMLNELRNRYLKTTLQTVFTFPHFLSWVIISGMLFNLLGESGPFNRLVMSFGGEMNVLSNADSFRYFLTITNNWKEMGWNTIIYLAALSGVDPALYEAAQIDGAGRWHKVRYIDWPGIRPTAVILLIIFIGNAMTSGSGGFNQIFNLYNPAVYSTGDIIDTYIYRQAFSTGMPFGEVTAIGLFKSVINFVLILSANKLASWMSDGERGLF